MKSVVKFSIKQEAVFEFGLQPETVTRMVAGALNGQYAGKFRTIDEEVDLMVRIDTFNYTGQLRSFRTIESVF